MEDWVIIANASLLTNEYLNSYGTEKKAFKYDCLEMRTCEHWCFAIGP